MLDFVKEIGYKTGVLERPAPEVVECGWNVICQAQQNPGTAAAIGATLAAIAIGSAAYVFGYGRQQNAVDATPVETSEPRRSARLANKG